MEWVQKKKMREPYAYIMPQRGHLNLGFCRGTALPDPNGLLEGTGKALRHVKLRSIDNAKRLEAARLILEAIKERKLALGK